MKTISTFLSILLLLNFSSVLASNSAYCERYVAHDNHNPEIGTGLWPVYLTISNIDNNSFYVQIDPIEGDTTDLLLVQNLPTGFTQTSEEVLNGVSIKKTFYSTENIPDSISIQLLWSLTGEEGNAMLSEFNVPFDAACMSTPDTEAPTDFSVSIGEISSSSVELLLYAIDNSGQITYTISYNEIELTSTGTSGSEKSYLVEGLSEETAYTFEVRAKDAAGNVSTNSPLSLDATTIAEPTPESAPTSPSHAEADVISVYSDAYSSIATNLNPNWGQNTEATEIDFSGNNILKYSKLNYQGLEYTSSDVSSMLFVHIDYWTGNATSFKLSLISEGPKENAYDIAANEGLILGEWVSLDIPLSVYTVPDLDKVFQFKTEGDGSIYLDNIYFWKTPDTETEDVSLSSLLVDGDTIAGFMPTTLTYDVALPYGTTTVPSISATSTNSLAQVSINEATSIPGTSTIIVTSESGNTVVSYTVNFSATLPQEAAPLPTHQSEDVVAVYSGAYASNIASNLNPGWGQSTEFSIVEIDGDEAMCYANLNYQGLEYTLTDISIMEYVHLDYWTSDATAFSFFLIAGGENAYDVTASSSFATAQWVSLDIPLSYFEEAGRDLSSAIQFKTTGNGTIYLDNIFFWKTPTAENEDATLSALLVDGDTIEGFSSIQKSYDYALPYGTTNVPSVSATTSSANATMSITEATSLPGTTTIEVISESMNDTMLYTVSFVANLPATKAPEPTAAEEDVIAVYSGTYSTNIATNLNPGWGQLTKFSIIEVEDDEMMMYGNLNYQGTEFLESDISVMNYLHFDYWTTDATALEFYLIADGENSYNVASELGIKTAQWVGVDVPLSYYADAGRDLTQAIQFKVVGNGTICFDNLYFYKGETASINETNKTKFSIYPNPAQDELKISSESEIQTLEIYDLAGRALLTKQAIPAENSIDISTLLSGTYLVKITSNGTTHIQKLIKK